MKAVIEANDLHQHYGREPVLRGLDCRIADGEFFIVIGPNGSGKTTLLKTLAGILKPHRGTVTLLDHRLGRHNRAALARQVAYVPQTASIDFPFSVRELVLMGRSPHLGILGLAGAADREIARQALAFTHIDHLADRRLNQISGGERQRAQIARAICQQPDIILLDEPTAALDLAHQVRIMDLMETLIHERRTTVVMVSHDINLAALYADRLLLLKEGREVSSGPPGAVLTYDTLEAAYGCPVLVDTGPVGDAPRINLVPGRFLWGDGLPDRNRPSTPIAKKPSQP
jgi:iron complex transport system ATP-binding protein